MGRGSNAVVNIATERNTYLIGSHKNTQNGLNNLLLSRDAAFVITLIYLKHSIFRLISPLSINNWRVCSQNGHNWPWGAPNTAKVCFNFWRQTVFIAVSRCDKIESFRNGLPRIEFRSPPSLTQRNEFETWVNKKSESKNVLIPLKTWERLGQMRATKKKSIKGARKRRQKGGQN